MNFLHLYILKTKANNESHILFEYIIVDIYIA